MKYSKLNNDLSLVVITISEYNAEFIYGTEQQYDQLFANGVHTVISFPHAIRKYFDDPSFMLLVKNDDTLDDTTLKIHKIIEKWIDTAIKEEAIFLLTHEE